MKTQKDVAELVASLNIQFDNLCQVSLQILLGQFVAGISGKVSGACRTDACCTSGLGAINIRCT